MLLAIFYTCMWQLSTFVCWVRTKSVYNSFKDMCMAMLIKEIMIYKDIPIYTFIISYVNKDTYIDHILYYSRPFWNLTFMSLKIKTNDLQFGTPLASEEIQHTVYMYAMSMFCTCMKCQCLLFWFWRYLTKERIWTKC